MFAVSVSGAVPKLNDMRVVLLKRIERVELRLPETRQRPPGNSL
jgi:hypothetical protein